LTLNFRYKVNKNYIKENIMLNKLDSYSTLNNQDDVCSFLNQYRSFHDSCIVKCSISTGYSVNQKLSMKVPFNNQCKVSIIIHKQNIEFRSIELVFEEVIQFNFVPAQENYDRIIYSALLKYENGIFYWADDNEWNSQDKDYETCWISAKKLKWRNLSPSK
jgi:hypothetical protein